MSESSVDLSSALNVLVALPTSLQIIIFTQWVHLSDIVTLDSALCSRSLRKAVFVTWNDPFCIFANHKQKEVTLADELIFWIVTRKLKISPPVVISIQIAASKSFDSFFEVTGSSLKAIRFPENLELEDISTEELISLANRVMNHVSTCLNLEELTIIFESQKVDLVPVLDNCKKLKTLFLPFANKTDVKVINQHAHALETLNLSYFANGYSEDDSEDDQDEEENDVEAVEGEKQGGDSEEENVESDYTINNTLRKVIFLYTAAGIDYEFFLQFLCANINLRELYCDRLTWHDMCYIFAQCPLLTTVRAAVSLEDDYLFDEEEGVQHLVEHTKHMRYMQLSHARRTDFLSEQSLLSILQSCLHYIVFAAYEFDDSVWMQEYEPQPNTDVAAVAPGKSHLQVLHVRSVSISGLRAIFALCPHLVELGIHEPQDAAALVDLIVTHNIRRLILTVPYYNFQYESLLQLTGLESLVLNNGGDITASQVIQIAFNNPNLKCLKVRRCFEIDFFGSPTRTTRDTSGR